MVYVLADLCYMILSVIDGDMKGMKMYRHKDKRDSNEKGDDNENNEGSKEGRENREHSENEQENKANNEENEQENDDKENERAYPGRVLPTEHDFMLQKAQREAEVLKEKWTSALELIEVLERINNELVDEVKELKAKLYHN
jgi:hypothetical protein